MEPNWVWNPEAMLWYSRTSGDTMKAQEANSGASCAFKTHEDAVGYQAMLGRQHGVKVTGEPGQVIRYNADSSGLRGLENTYGVTRVTTWPEPPVPDVSMATLMKEHPAFAAGMLKAAKEDFEAEAYAAATTHINRRG